MRPSVGRRPPVFAEGGEKYHLQLYMEVSWEGWAGWAWLEKTKAGSTLAPENQEKDPVTLGSGHCLGCKAWCCGMEFQNTDEMAETTELDFGKQEGMGGLESEKEAAHFDNKLLN